jgi:translation initiation factor IF-3
VPRLYVLALSIRVLRAHRSEKDPSCRSRFVPHRFEYGSLPGSEARVGPCYNFQVVAACRRPGNPNKTLDCAGLQEDRIDKRFIRMNERIRAREIRVIDADGNQLGIMAPYDAIKRAREQNLDLVEISPNAVPPVCRIMDYGKFLYEQEKKERAAKKNQKQIVLKEVKFSVNVDEHDYVTKRNHVLRFLGEGDKVKASLRFRGREMAHQNLGRNVLERLIKEVGEKGIVEFRPRMEGNTMHAILAPPKQTPGGKKPDKPQPPAAANAAAQQVAPATGTKTGS